ARTVRARAYASNGTTAAAKVRTRSLKGAQRARVTLVEVYCTVRDSHGRFLTDLKEEDFTILEAGRPQQIAVFSAERKPVHLVLLFDTSASMARDRKLETAQEAAIGFVEALEPDDTAALVTFSDMPRILQPRTGDTTALESAISSIEAKGGTALYDAILSAVQLLKGHEGRKAIILISDGRDESADGLGPGSVATFEEALEAVLKSETAVYAIGTGARIAQEFDYLHRRTLGEILSTLADGSGGRAYFIKKASKLKQAYRRVEDELRHQYTLAYYPPDAPAAGSIRGGRGALWRPIEVRVSRPRARVTARKGYYLR
ncbi:MAG: VWA domain-containing protein, partial [Planctomycetota bacterium]